MNALENLQINEERFSRLLELARVEDLDTCGDITTALLQRAAGFSPRGAVNLSAALLANADGVAAGLALVPTILHYFDSALRFEAIIEDGLRVEHGAILGRITGPQPAILTVERTLLNFLQRLSGIASLTRRYVEAVAGTNAKIYDTRKTTPGWRDLEKYAVRCGGGWNHRFGLHDAVLVKDNHLADIPLEQLADYASKILHHLSELQTPPQFVEFEVDNLQQLDELLNTAGIDIILLDNFSTADLRTAVQHRDAAGLRNRLQLEASGGVNLTTVRAVAETGVERISVGALTHSAAALDISMEFGAAFR